MRGDEQKFLATPSHWLSGVNCAGGHSTGHSVIQVDPTHIPDCSTDPDKTCFHLRAPQRTSADKYRGTVWPPYPSLSLFPSENIGFERTLFMAIALPQSASHS